MTTLTFGILTSNKMGGMYYPPLVMHTIEIHLIEEPWMIYVVIWIATKLINWSLGHAPHLQKFSLKPVH